MRYQAALRPVKNHVAHAARGVDPLNGVFKGGEHPLCDNFNRRRGSFPAREMILVNKPAVILHTGMVKSRLRRRLDRQIDPCWQHLSEFFERLAAMTHGGFSLPVDFAEGFAEGRIEKQRIVAETV